MYVYMKSASTQYFTGYICTYVCMYVVILQEWSYGHLTTENRWSLQPVRCYYVCYCICCKHTVVSFILSKECLMTPLQ